MSLPREKLLWIATPPPRVLARPIKLDPIKRKGGSLISASSFFSEDSSWNSFSRVLLS
jgi:hypothetical protein